MIKVHKAPVLNEKDNFGLELFLPKITFCSSLFRFSCSLRMRWRSSSISRCSSMMANRSSAYNRKFNQLIKFHLFRHQTIKKSRNLPIYVEPLQFYDYFQLEFSPALHVSFFPLPIKICTFYKSRKTLIVLPLSWCWRKSKHYYTIWTFKSN